MNTPLSINEIQKELLYMGVSICNILEEHNIPYMLAFGTLLGAVRHKGFIPWDDDFDIFLFSDSYDCALDLLRKELPKDMEVEFYDNEPLYFHSWAHVKSKNTIAECKQFPQDEVYARKGLSVDLYLLTLMKEADVDIFLKKEMESYYQRRFDKGTLSEKDYQIYISQVDNVIKNNKFSLMTGNQDVYAMALKERMIYKNHVFPLRKYVFENKLFYGPNNYDEILKSFYGDYMRLPPIEKRVPHYSSVYHNNNVDDVKFSEWNKTDFQKETIVEFFINNCSDLPSSNLTEIEYIDWINKHFKLGKVFIAYQVDKLVGICFGYMNDNINKKSHCSLLIISEVFRGLGLGKKLLSLFVDEARRAGMVQVTLNVVETNQNAIYLYKSLGFKYLSRHEKLKDRIVMSLSLK